jgi:hypothetical protein
MRSNVSNKNLLRISTKLKFPEKVTRTIQQLSEFLVNNTEIKVTNSEKNLIGFKVYTEIIPG